MKLALLIVVAVAIVAGAAASYFHYQSWRDRRYDDLIVESADRHNVDPAVVKALIRAQAQLNYAAVAPQEARGLMLVPKDVADKYLEMRERGPWRYVCPNRRYRNHDPAKPELFTADERGQYCKVPGCGQALVEELLDPPTNIEVACWYLGRLNVLLSTICRGPVPPGLLVAVYRWVPVGEADAFDPYTFTPSDEQNALLGAFTRAYTTYAQQFEKRARRGERE